MHGIQPELDVGTNETLYGAIRYDDERCEASDIVQSTYFSGLDIVPGNLELMEFEHETPKELASRRGKDQMFFARVAQALATVEDLYDVVVIDCPPQLGFLTLWPSVRRPPCVNHRPSADARRDEHVPVSHHDIHLLSTLSHKRAATCRTIVCVTYNPYEPGDAPHTQMVTFMRSLFEDRVLTNPMVKSTAISDAGITKQTLYEVSREQFTRTTYDRAIEALQAVNGEIETLSALLAARLMRKGLLDDLVGNDEGQKLTAVNNGFSEPGKPAPLGSKGAVGAMRSSLWDRAGSRSCRHRRSRPGLIEDSIVPDRMRGAEADHVRWLIRSESMGSRFRPAAPKGG